VQTQIVFIRCSSCEPRCLLTESSAEYESLLVQLETAVDVLHHISNVTILKQWEEIKIEKVANT
jgi:hypothetical protein